MSRREAVPTQRVLAMVMGTFVEQKGNEVTAPYPRILYAQKYSISPVSRHLKWSERCKAGGMLGNAKCFS